MWKVEEYENDISETSIRVVDGEGLTVADNEPYYPAKITSENAETIVSAVNEVAELREQLATARGALVKCQKSLAMIIEPDSIKQSTVLHAFAQAMEAEASARAALTILGTP